MKNFIEKVPYKIRFHKDSSFTALGSCFTTHIGDKLIRHGINGQYNPFGTLFDPFSILRTLERITHKTNFDKNKFFKHPQDGWFHYDISHKMGESSPDLLASKLQHAINIANQKLSNSKYLIITLGTAYAFYHHPSKKWVSNCHKMPQIEFERRLLSVTEIEIALRKIVGLFSMLNPNGQVIFTISPVRHLRTGVVKNNISKSYLRVALNEVLNDFNQTSYFPAYEIVIDELRDYDFFHPNGMHPNEQAIAYVWSKFKEHYHLI